MKFAYEDLLSGDSIPVNGIAHFHSPHLYELNPNKGIGAWKYNLYLNIMSWGQDEIIKFLRTATKRGWKALDKAENITVFQLITIIDYVRDLFIEGIGFFIDENIEWDKNERCYITKDKSTQERYGLIDENNFEDVRDMILQMNYINLGNKGKPTKFDSPAAEQLWKRAQQYMINQKKRAPDKKMALGNLISKLCAGQTGYTLLNIYELTVFQFYDQFFQYQYLKAMSMNDTVFCIHGGKKYDSQEWLKPLF